jgi:nicotinamide riboside kinase
MRISISGTHSTGKTVLARACYDSLVKKYPEEIDIIDEVAREVIAKGFPLNQDATLDSYINYLLLQIQAERLAKCKHVVSDRSLIDLLAYVITNSNPIIPNYFLDLIKELIWVEKEYFDLYCYLPIEFDLIVDDVRPIEKEYRSAVDRTLTQIMSEFEVRVETIKGSLEERREKVLSLFENQ